MDDCKAAEEERRHSRTILALLRAMREKSMSQPYRPKRTVKTRAKVRTASIIVYGKDIAPIVVSEREDGQYLVEGV